MDKLGVDVTDTDPTKTATEKENPSCPKCDKPLQKNVNVPACPKCGTRPFEKPLP